MMKTARTSVLVIGSLTAIMIAVAIAARLPGQGGGSRAGAHAAATFPGQPVATPSASLDHEAIESNIAIVGTAEIRVKPTAVRVIMALTSQGATAEECMQANGEKEKALTEAWSKLGVPEDKVFLDFISMLPVYEWNLQQQEGGKYLVEDLSGYLVQTNAHIEVANEAEARAAVRAAFRLGISDIISFDYWCESLDDYKVQAQKRALADAQRKADMLLTAHFQNVHTPKPLNIREQTQVIYPKSLYESFTNDYSQTLHRTYHRQSLPEIRAFRPKNTHYRGFFGYTDSQDPRLPMQPEISVVSTISCYYAAPAEKRDEAGK
jgi:uncharacterized protein YggE